MSAKVPAVETDGEKENDANGSEWEVEEVKLGTSVLFPAPVDYIWDFVLRLCLTRSEETIASKPLLL